MNGRRWTADELDELRRRYADERAEDIARDLGRPLTSMYAKANELGLTKSEAFIHRPTGGNPKHRTYSAEEDATIRRRYPHEDTATLAADMGRTKIAIYQRARNLGLSKTQEYVERHCRALDPETGRAHRFAKGHVPANKGLRRPGWHRGRMRETQFRKGHTPHTYKPIGTVQKREDGQHFVRKVSDEGLQRERWQPIHRLVWIEHNGPIPDGHLIAFRNGFKPQRPEDITIDRLECITFAENCRRNSFRNRYPKDIVKAIEAKAHLSRAINKQEGRHSGRRKRKAETRHRRTAGASVRHDKGSAKPE